MEKDWIVKEKIKNSDFDKFKDVHPLLLQILFNRGIKKEEEIRDFLDESGKIHDSFLFRKMEEALDLIIAHIKKKNKIIIYGDYDADGVTSSALLYDVLKLFKAVVEVYIPHRVYEGYGLNEDALKSLREKGTKLIITVDGGIRAKKEVEMAKEMGMEVIITDHHIPPEFEKDYPECIILNPLTKDETYPFKYLAGVGVAFKLTSALISKSKLDEENKQKLVERQLDLVALGTVADCVSLQGENRALVKRGLKEMDKERRVGLRELAQVAHLKKEKKYDSWNIGFQLAPRINAVGRLDHAETAFQLLVEKDEKEARKMAMELDKRNTQRQDYTLELFNSIDENLGEQKKEAILVALCPQEKEDNNWNEGVIGLVAGKLSSKYYRPALVLTETEDGLKGSGRSIPDFNLISAIEDCAEFLDKYGGHPQACGFSLSKDKLEAFRKKIREIAREKIDFKNIKPKITVDQEINLEDLNLDLAIELEKLKPFGEGNGKPIFLSKNILVVDVLTMGLEGQHLKLKLKSENSGLINALAFSQAERWNNIKVGEKIDLLYSVEINDFNNRKEVQLKIVDIKYGK